jgi:2-polyprenyl-3-methyl-5-hydroxy-6-metoxy-1,4-benzoquinol methylase
MTMLTSESRAERISALGFDYAAQPKRAVDSCNLCGGSVFGVVAHRDRYGYPAEAHGCRTCGLVFLNPVMTAEAYESFYVGTYRPLVSAFHGRLIDARTIQAEQREYAEERGNLLAPFLGGMRGARLLDIGGSTGVVAHAFARRFGLEATVIDPAPLETAEAQALGLETIPGLVERHDFGARRFEVVVLCQTVDHLLDVAGTLARVRDVIADGGVLFVDIVDFRAAYLRQWSVEDAVKIDHPYYLVEETAESFLRRAGFEILRSDYAADHLHVGYVCRPGRPLADALPSEAAVTALWRELRFVQNAARTP